MLDNEALRVPDAEAERETLEVRDGVGVVDSVAATVGLPDVLGSSTVRVTSSDTDIFELLGSELDAEDSDCEGDG